MLMNQTNESKPKSRKSVMKAISAEFPDLFIRTTEEFGINAGGIWTSGESGIFDYWNSEKCVPKMQKLLDKCNWFYEFYDAGTVMLYPA